MKVFLTKYRKLKSPNSFRPTKTPNVIKLQLRIDWCLWCMLQRRQLRQRRQKRRAKLAVCIISSKWVFYGTICNTSHL